MHHVTLKTMLVVGLAALTTALLGVPGCSCSSDDEVQFTSCSPDADVPDATLDSSPDDATILDAGVDVGPDFLDANDPFDAGIVQNPLTPDQFLTSAAQLYCIAAKDCCGAVNGGTPAFDLSKCVAFFRAQGWEASAAGTTVPGVLDGGNLSFDAVIAKECLRNVASIGCVNSAATFHTATANCLAAWNGLRPLGDACVQTVECATGYCAKPLVDGGAAGALVPGVCTALKSIGDVCNYAVEDKNNGFGHDECTHRNNPTNFCSTSNGITGTCAAQLADGLLPPYFGNVQCLSGVQNAPVTINFADGGIPAVDDFKCGGSQALIPTAGTCNITFAISP